MRGRDRRCDASGFYDVAASRPTCIHRRDVNSILILRSASARRTITRRCAHTQTRRARTRACIIRHVRSLRPWSPNWSGYNEGESRVTERERKRESFLDEEGSILAWTRASNAIWHMCTCMCMHARAWAVHVICRTKNGCTNPSTRFINEETPKRGEKRSRSGDLRIENSIAIGRSRIILLRILGERTFVHKFDRSNSAALITGVSLGEYPALAKERKLRSLNNVRMNFELWHLTGKTEI